MLANLGYLVLVLLLINFVVESPSVVLVESAWLAFVLGLVLYVCVLGLVVWQGRRWRTYWVGRVVNIELLLFLVVFHFVLVGGRVFAGSQALLAGVSLFFYLFGLEAYYWAKGGSSQLRILLPFVVPFVVFSVLMDFFPGVFRGEAGLWLTLGLGVVFVLLVMAFLPVLIQWIWDCRPIEDLALLERLEGVCRRARFKHAGIKVWTVLHAFVTAAIVGIVPRFRYILFTERMLREFRVEELEAVLAHEIGHSYHRHLIMYPFIVGGMIAVASFFPFFFGDAIAGWFNRSYEAYPSMVWSILYPLAIFVPYVLIMAVYFRVVFGFFSRLFERQADLHVFRLGLPPQQMIAALDRVGVVTGYTHDMPSWHHYSIRDRIEFLQAAIANPILVERQDDKVRFFFSLYLVVFIFLTGFLIWGSW